MKHRHILFAIAVSMFAGAALSQAAITTLTDGNISMTVDDASQNGSNAHVDSILQLFQGQLWYRVGSSGPEQSIDNIGPAVSVATANSLTDTYTAANQFSLSVAWLLTGGSAGHAMYTENVVVTNLSTGSLDFHVFDYRDFDLTAGSGDDSAAFSGSSVTLHDATTTETTTFSATPSEVEAALFASTLNKLNDGSASTLNNNTTIGPGDATWAAQFDESVELGGTMTVNTTTVFGPVSSVPLPKSAWMGLALLPLAGWIGRRKSSARNN